MDVVNIGKHERVETGSHLSRLTARTMLWWVASLTNFHEALVPSVERMVDINLNATCT